MTLDREAFCEAYNRYTPPGPGERWLNDVLNEAGLDVEALVKAELLFRFDGPTSEINNLWVSTPAERFLRRGQGMNAFVVLPGREAELLEKLRYG